ncbi:hypothetical protein [Streptacidiphilus anmyonensis]|uniref:hypothetical protein n=1 Tax=Streptacidiphilus anmyonensis TaxID=405782 RepID=UPI0005A8C570|nr:hypothetical protein [Streptacidiphilus anmyonensis]
MDATARRAASLTLAVCAALALSACHSTASGGSAAPAPSRGSAAPAAAGSACRNLVVTAAVRAEVTRAYAAESRLVHIEPVPGGFLYGACGGVTYAASRFEPTGGATEQEKVASQDEGSVPKYFSLGPSGAWTYLGSAGFPATGGCIGGIPQALAAVWGGCRTR